MHGQYKWKRYPFGLISAQDKYQCRMEIFAELDVRLIRDDIAGNSYNNAENDTKLRAVLQAARDNGVWFN